MLPNTNVYSVLISFFSGGAVQATDAATAVGTGFAFPEIKTIRHTTLVLTPCLFVDRRSAFFHSHDEISTNEKVCGTKIWLDISYAHTYTQLHTALDRRTVCSRFTT